jgi:predicted HAD superfamily Cof-like phosphohydrolase
MDVTMSDTDHSTTTYVTEFHRVFDVAIDAPWTDDLIKLRLNLLLEELCELESALLARDHLNVAQESADLEYVLHGTAISLGIDLDAAVAEVYRSNMSKLSADGTPLKRADGKILKGPNFRPPDMSAVIAGVS